MPSTLKSLSKVCLLAVCTIAAAFAFSPTAARADDIALQGTTTGYFNGTPGLTSLNSGNLNFTSTAFNTSTVGGTAGLDLGYFLLTSTPAGTTYSYAGDSFTINVNFSLPLGSGSADSTAQLMGNISQNSGGVWVVNFSPASQDVYFNGGTNYFQLAVNSVSLAPNQNVELTGFVDYTGTGGGSTAAPEPPTLILAALGIAGTFLLKKRLVFA